MLVLVEVVGLFGLGLSVEVARKPAKPIPEKLARIRDAEWAKEGVKVDARLL
jgi:hypothetical protein